MKVIAPKIDSSQCGNQKGASTEPLLVQLMDKMMLMDNNNSHFVNVSEYKIRKIELILF